jgi:hypothetical protein
MSDRFTDDEVERIRMQVWSGTSLEGLTCPRDSEVLRVYFLPFRAPDLERSVEGVLHGEWGDVTEISLECWACGADRARIPLRRG